jgi:hypothetical protein
VRRLRHAVDARPRPRQHASTRASTLILVMTFSWPSPRRGSRFTTSISCAIVLRPVARPHGRGPARPPPHLAIDHQEAVVVAGVEVLTITRRPCAPPTRRLGALSSVRRSMLTPGRVCRQRLTTTAREARRFGDGLVGVRTTTRARGRGDRLRAAAASSGPSAAASTAPERYGGDAGRIAAATSCPI